jgi:hypothetical protein
VDSIENSLDTAALEDLVLVSKKGTQAQYATAFAMMARSQGFPTRLVVGYAVPGKGAARTVESTDVIIYPEVQFTKIGWVPFAPGPRDETRGVPVVRKVEKPKEPEPTEEPTPTPSPTPTPTPTEEPQPEQRQSAGLLRWLAPLLLVLLVLGWPFVVRWRRGRVRGRFRTGSADEQVSGAWAYTRRALRRIGQPLDDTVSPATYTASENRSLAVLARFVEAAMYAPESLQDSDAQEAWQRADEVVAAAVRRASWRRRLRWLLVPWVVGGRPRT